jgi:hypothetical protein
MKSGWYRRSIGPTAKEVIYVIAQVGATKIGAPLYRCIHFSGFNKLENMNLNGNKWYPWTPSDMHLRLAVMIACGDEG